MTNLTDITGFDWDEGNARKNEKHNVSMAEAEQVFFNAALSVPIIKVENHHVISTFDKSLHTPWADYFYPC